VAFVRLDTIGNSGNLFKSLGQVFVSRTSQAALPVQASQFIKYGIDLVMPGNRL
jgi:hypothetical protein